MAKTVQPNPKKRKPATPRSALTFERALEGYWLEKQRNFSQNTVNDYTITFRRFQAYTDNSPIDQIDSDTIRRFLAYLTETFKHSNKTLSNAWTALSSFFTWAEKELNLPHPIHGRVAQPEFRRPVITAYTQTETKAMIAACEFTHAWYSNSGRQTQTKRATFRRDQAIILALVDTGIRASELCDLEIRDYRANQGQLTIRHGKGDKQRSVFLAQNSRKYLWKYLVERGKDLRPDEPLFTTRNGTKLGRDELRHMIQRAAERAGVVGANVHKFRHTFAINFLRNNGSPLELQELLGHEKMETIRIYVRLAEVDLKEAQRRASVADNWRL